MGVGACGVDGREGGGVGVCSGCRPRNRLTLRAPRRRNVPDDTNEKLSGLIGQYSAKGTCKKTLPQSQLDRIADELNNRTRKKI